MSKSIFFEPMTAFTDLLITAFGVWFALELKDHYQLYFMNVHWYFGRAMWFVAFASLMGALYHGLGPHFSPRIQGFIWKLTLILVGLTSFSLVLGAFHHVFPFHTIRYLRWFMGILLAIYFIVIFRDPRFFNAVLFYVPAMLFVLGVMIYSHFNYGQSGAVLVIYGILIAFVGAGVQMSGFDLHKHFNHNDIYHLIQIASLYFIFKGSLLLTDYGIR